MFSKFYQDNSFPKEIKGIQGKDYTIKLLITEDNIKKRDFDYVATGIVPGFNYVEETEEISETHDNTQTSVGQVTNLIEC